MEDQSRSAVESDQESSSTYRNEFLWPHEDGSVEEAGYEFSNGQTEAYRLMWWGILVDRILERK